MSKGLEALEIVKTAMLSSGNCLLNSLWDYTDVIEKELKALEIIKKYICVNKPFGSACYIYLNDESEMIPQEEFDLLKEVLP